MHVLARKEVLALALAFSFLAASIDAVDAKRRAGSNRAKSRAEVELKILVDPILRFGSRLLRTMGAEKENTIFSPVSIHSGLSLVLLGASNASDTEKELQLGLSYGPCEKEANRLFEAYTKLIDRVKKRISSKRKRNGGNKRDPIIDIWTMAIAKEAKEPPKQEYLKAIDQYFGGSFKMVHNDKAKEIEDLASDINEWAKRAGFEQELVKESELREEFALMLLSAVRVDAFWFDNFVLDKEKNLFLNHGEKLVDGTKIRQSRVHGNYVEFRTNARSFANESSESFKELAPLDFYASDVQLRGGVSFASFMPAEKGVGKLAELEKKLLASDENGMLTLCKTFQVLDSSQAQVTFRNFSMPQFRIEANIDLNEQLKSMGIKRVFNKGQAELSKMSKLHMHVDKVMHQAMIEITDKGLGAAGFTKVMMPVFVDRSDHIDLKLDRPFLFVVRYNRVPMLLGHLVKI